MQYVLTREEYDTHRQSEIDERDAVLEMMRRLLVPEGQCIHDDGHNGDYCDHCPLSGLGETAWEHLKLLCTRNRRYSK